MSILEERIEARRRSGLLRNTEEAKGIPLISNDYLGLSRHPNIADAMREGLVQGVPMGSTGSRLLSGQHPLHSRLEQAFATWQSSESALLFSSGYAANVGLLGGVPQPGETILSDELNHASLIDGIRMSKADRAIVPHLDLDAYSQELTQRPDGTCWVVVESVYSMDGDRAPLRELASLCQLHNARLVVDEAHATGLFGSTGAGLIEALDVRASVFASIHTCGKSLGQSGAMVCMGSIARALLLNSARSFVYSTAPPPIACIGILEAMEMVQKNPHLRARPLSLARRLRSQLGVYVDIGNSESHIIPLMAGTVERANQLSEDLRSRGWWTRPIRPPTVPTGKCRVRIVMRSDLSDGDIDRLATDIRWAVGRLP